MRVKVNKLQPYLLFEGKSIGGKAEQLVNMNEQGFTVPPFKILPAEYLDQQLREAENPVDLIDNFEFSTDDKNKILNQLSRDSTYFSIRSSAIGEDGKSFSFAGQFETYLYVNRAQIFEKIKEVWKSAYSDRIVAYRKQNNITTPIRMAVVIQHMIHAEVSGVMFGVNPVTEKENEMLISAVYGLGEGLVSGALNADNFYITDGKLEKSEIAEKTERMTHDLENEGVLLSEVAENKINDASLDQTQIDALTKQLTALNSFYEFPQDVEWAYEKGQLYILQSRPITHLKKSKTGTKIVWDNSNIIESYPGVTTPLTFSFIREMYRVVYIQFCQLLGLSNKTLADNEEVFANMLGLLRGRVFYNLRSWYRVLSLLPGYTINAAFMENMMGIKERFELEDQYVQGKWSARWQMFMTILKMIKAFWKLPSDRNRFLSFLDKTIAEYKAIDFESESPESLMAQYHTFEEILTKQWKPPLVNDFFAMIYFGVFKKLIVKYLGEDCPHIHNDLLAHSNDIISVQPMIQSLNLAKNIIANSEQKLFFQNEDSKTIWNELETGRFPTLYKDIKNYLNKYGERCLGELKLETISYNQAPDKFIKILQSYIKNPAALEALNNGQSNALREKSQQIVDDKIGNTFFKKRILRYFTNKTRDLVSNRENLRFERTRGFGIVREIFSAMGVAFQERNLIENDRDIFYLTKEEIFDYIKGTSILPDLKSTIEDRKMKYQNYEADEFVPERVETYGVVYDELIFKEEEETLAEGDMSGIACCPGVIESEVIVVHSPDQVSDIGGKIMVTSSTDPGWVSLFPTSSAILVERGSLLSHSAIVARELGIPCIVSIKGLLKRLKTGDVVKMDGSTGQVKIISNAEN